MTSAGAKALLDGIIDYAGLFPPAQLSLDEAIRNYARYRSSADRQVLGRFIIPAPGLAELSPYVEELFSPEVLLQLTILGRGGQTGDAFLAGLPRDVEDMLRFYDVHGPRTHMSSIELRLPPEIAGTGLLREVYERLCYRRLHPPTVFLELSLGADWRSSQDAAIRAIGRFNEEARPGRRKPTPACGFKLRCGGTNAGAVPPAEQVVGAVFSCLESRVPFKATAGLHHPLRRFDPALGVPAHGFLNLFGMGVLAWTGQVERAEAAEMLTDEDPAHFAFDDTGFRWKNYRATVADIQTARREAMTSFGSCSFDEPCEDLRSLGLLS